LLLSLWKDLHDVRVLWQAAAAVVSVAIALGVSYLLRPRMHGATASKWEIGLGGLRRLVFPLTALTLVLSGRWALSHYQSVSLLNIAVPLLTAMAIIRIVVYMLRVTFAPSGAPASSEQGSRLRDANVRESGAAPSRAGVASVSGVTSPKGAPVPPSDGVLFVFERTLAWLVWLTFVLYVLGLTSDIIEFFDGVSLNIGRQRITLLLIGQAVLWVIAALLLALWIGRVLEARLMTAHSMDVTLRVMLTKLLRAVLVLFAILVALPAVGVDLTALSVFGGALGVGIGFGLQKIASSYISGFIILFDRSVKIGDLITIDNRVGEVTTMTARYVVVRGLDGTEAIIPNEAMITSTVINHSYSDRTVCVAIPIQISYRSDLDAAMHVLVEAAQAHPRALKNPEPKAMIKAFGDNGIDLELGVWVDDPEKGKVNLRSDIYRAVWREFQARGIEIPYPQREVRLVGDNGSQHGAAEPLAGRK
jgi:small-conductance mechanosensitive channel